MISMYIGSGDISSLLAGKETKAHQELMQRFVSGVKPHYNAEASPIDALRTGAILEKRYLLTLPENYFYQVVVFSKEMDVFRSSLDFPKIENNNIVDFDELKSVNLPDFLEMIDIKDDQSALLSFVKKRYKSYYNQVQEQLYCTELDSCNLVFLSVESYEDEVNYTRNIQPSEVVKVRIYRDEDVISMIRERGKVFQQIKDYYTKDVIPEPPQSCTAKLTSLLDRASKAIEALSVN